MAGSPALPWLRPFLILSLVLSVPPLLYWFGHVERRMDEAQRQDFTTLAAITTQLHERLDAYRSIAEKADCSADAVRYLKSILPNSPREKTPLTAADQATLRLQLSVDGGLDLHVFAGPACNTLDSIVAVKLDSLIAWSLVENEFEGLLVLDRKTGNLVAQDRRLPLQPLGLPVELHSGGKAGDKPIDLASFLKANGGGTDTRPFTANQDTYVRIAGVDYLPFMQVLNVPVAVDKVTPPANGAADPAATSITLVVVALLQKDQLQRAAIALSPGQLVYVMSLIACGVLMIPFLKLRFIGPHERMRPSDVWLLGGAVLAGTALAVLVVLQFCSTQLLRERFDQGLQHLAASIQAHAGAEANAAVMQLTSSAPRLLATPATKRGDGAILTQQAFSYALFDSVFTADLGGKQNRKWTPRTIATPMVAINDNDYFSSALSLDYGSRETRDARLKFAFEALVSPTTGLQLGVFALPTAAHTLADAAHPLSTKPDGIIALATQLYSINQPLLSEPFQFVVLDKHGQVVFQAAQESYWHERFFETVRNGAALERAARLANQNAGSTINYYSYHEKIYRMLVRPLPELDATLVVYYDTRVYESLATRVFTTTALFALGLIGCVLLSIGVARRVFGENALDWAWPSESHVAQYALGILISLTAGVLGVLAWLLLPSPIILWFFLLAPGLAVVLLTARLRGFTKHFIAARLRAKWADFTPQLKRFYPTLYVVFAVIALLCCLATPLGLVFDEVLAANAAAFEHTTARKLTALEHQQDRFPAVKLVNAAAAANSPQCDAAQQTIADLRCVAPDRVYAMPSNYRTFVDQSTHFGRYHDCVAIDALGHCEYDARVDGVANSEAVGSGRFTPANLASWLARFGADGIDLSWSFARIVSGDLVVSSMPFVVNGQLLCAWFWPGILLLACGLSWVVRSVSTHVFGLELIGDGVLPNEADQQLAGRLLLLRPPRRVLDAMRLSPEPAAAQHQLTLNLCELDCEPDQFAQQYQTQTAVAVLQVEYRLADREWRNALLQLLHHPTVTKLVLVSAIDPFHFLAQRLHEATEALLIPELKDATEARTRCSELQIELSRWAVALSNVEKIRYAVPSHWLSATPQLAASRLAPELLDKLENECRWSDQLIDIGIRLLARSDLAQYRWSQIVSFIEDAAEPYYRSRWELCSRDEKLAMIQLAQEGLVNPKNVELVRRLARRRLVIVDPRFRLINASFREFVRKLEPADRITAWERSGATAWSRISTPLYALAAMVVAILLYTEQSFLTNTLAIATVASGTLGSLRNLYVMAKQAGSAAKLA